MGLAAVLVVTLACSGAFAGEPGQRALTFEERVAAQRAIEEVYWNRRSWPNPSLKPPLSAVMPDDVLRAKVEDSLRKSDALGSIWSRPLTTAQLQAELNRMASQSRDTAVLEELFNALGRDATLIGDTLIRDVLVDRLARRWYAEDSRFHGRLRAHIEASLSKCSSLSCRDSLDGHYSETTWTLRAGQRLNPPLRGPPVEVELDPADWSRLVSTLADRFRLPLARVSRGHFGEIEERPDSFRVMAIVDYRDDTLTTAEMVWDKTPFDTWWKGVAPRLYPTRDRAATGLALPSIEAGRTPSRREALPLGAPADRTSKANSPQVVFPRGALKDPRRNHLVVWTGTEMIIWGGESGHGETVGARYVPATDTWSSTSRPAGSQDRHDWGTAIWTGTEMILWGGLGASGWVNTGLRYSPSTNVWVPTSTDTGVPSARESHTAIWTGTEMIVWGGYSTSYLDTGARYDPSSDTWLPIPVTANTPTGRLRHAAAWTGSEMLVWGGYRFQGVGHEYLDTGGRYAPSTGTWTPMATDELTPTARHYHTAVWSGTKLIIWGGQDATGYVNSGGAYDPVSNSWSATSVAEGVPAPRFLHSAVWSGSEMIVWGGRTRFGVPLKSGGRYRPDTDTWAPVSWEAGVPAARALHTAVWTGSEMIVWGGDAGHLLNSGGRYDPVADSWVGTSRSGSVPVARPSPPAPATDSSSPTSVGRKTGRPRDDRVSAWTGDERLPPLQAHYVNLLPDGPISVAPDDDVISAVVDARGYSRIGIDAAGDDVTVFLEWASSSIPELFAPVPDSRNGSKQDTCTDASLQRADGTDARRFVCVVSGEQARLRVRAGTSQAPLSALGVYLIP